MSKITKDLLRNLRDDINTALVETSNKYNVNLRAGNVSYDPTLGTATIKLEVLTLTDDGEKRDIPAELFLKHADLLGLNKDDLNKEITISGRKFTVSGYKPKSRKNCILIKDVHSGKTFVTDIQTVKRQLSIK
jgi:hypothetical protein